MSEKFRMIQEALGGFGLDSNTLVVRRKLPDNWHGDLHYKIAVEGKSYSARFMAYQRAKEDASPFANLADEVLREQMRYVDHLLARGIPFMKRVKTTEGDAFVLVEDDRGVIRRCMLFEWMDGVHITVNTEEVAFRMGEMARRYHDASQGFATDVLPRKIHTENYLQMIELLGRERDKRALTGKVRKRLNAYIAHAKEQIRSGHRDPSESDLLVMTSDLNSVNVLWEETSRTINGIIDFEHLSLSDRVQDLTWLIKWYSRTEGMHSHKVSNQLAQALMYGYRAHELLTDDDYARFPALLWLSGCLNWNFVQKTVKLIQNDSDKLVDHLDRFVERGKLLTGLASDLKLTLF